MLVVTCLVLALQQGKPMGPDRCHRTEEYEYLFQETGYTLPEGRFEADLLVGRLEVEEFDEGPGDPDVTFDQFVAELAFGVFDWLMIEGELPLLRVEFDPGDSESGIGDIALEAKASLRSGPRNPIGFIPDVDVAGGVRLTLPTGDEDEGLGADDPTLEPFVAATYWIERWIGIHGRVGVQVQEDRRPFHNFNATAEFVPWGPELSLMAALSADREGSESDAVLIIPGAEYRFAGSPFALGASIPIGVNNDAPDWGFFLNGQLGF
ncbi:MAG TPA: transporter [Planctomycetota bacterium]|nr:transporter [Planctomycetota bacterium]